MKPYQNGTLLIPRLHPGVAQLIADDMACSDALAAQRHSNQNNSHLGDAFYTAVGGGHMETEQLKDLKDCVLQAAFEQGWPAERSISQQQTFDYNCAVLLQEKLQDVVFAECMRDTTWAFLCCGLLPHIVVWRFGNPMDYDRPVSLERFTGRFPRNTLGRLWWRGHLFRDPEREDDPYWLLRAWDGGLVEDNIVAISERPWTAAQPGLALCIAKSGLAHMEFAGTRVWRKPNGSSQSVREGLFREVMKRIIRYTAFLSWSALDPVQMKDLVDEIVKSTIEAQPASQRG